MHWLKKYRKSLNYFIKVLILSLLLWVIYKQVFVNRDPVQFYWLFLESFQGSNIFYLILAMLFMFLNWGIEAKKWQLVVLKLEKISLWRSFKAVFSGVSLAVFTPNRIGEYGGRIFYLKEEDRLKGIAVTLINSFSQILATITIGVAGILIYMDQIAGIETYIFYTVQFVSILSVILLLIGYFELQFLYNIFQKIPIFKKIEKYIQPYEEFTNRELLRLFLLSALRFLVFTTQYFLLLKFFGIHISVITGFILISSIFLIQTIIPSVALIELGIRGNVALFFFDFITNEQFGILSATFSLWLINLIIPAIIGMIFIMQINFFEKNTD